MSMTKERMRKVLNLLLDLECSPTELSIGWVNDGICQHDGIMLKEAAATVMSLLHNEGYSLFVMKDGVLVDWLGRGD
jgi:hypothetical protein